MDDRVRQAAARYWAVRSEQQREQAEAGRSDAGLRGAVTGGAQMDGFSELLRDTIVACGIPSECIFEKTHVELPGYYRPEKKWDLIVVHRGILGAAIELKSQCGPSFGNNFNNRVEEAIGSATDLWTAFREGKLGHSVKPWLGYLFLLEDCAESSVPVSVREPHFAVDGVFRNASYKERYAVFCRRLVLERLYDASCFLAVNFSVSPVSVSTPDPTLSWEHFVSSLRGHMTALAAL